MDYMLTGTKVHRGDCRLISAKTSGTVAEGQTQAIYFTTLWNLDPCRVCFKGIPGQRFAKALAEYRGEAYTHGK